MIATNKHSKLSSRKTNKVPRASSDSDMVFAFKTIPISDAMINKLIDDLPKWIKENPAHLTLSEFYLDRGVNKNHYYRLVNKYPHLKEAHERAMQILSDRIWVRSIEKKYDWNPARFMLSNMSEEYVYANDYHVKAAAEAKAKAEAQEQAKTLIVTRPCNCKKENNSSTE